TIVRRGARPAACGNGPPFHGSAAAKSDRSRFERAAQTSRLSVGTPTLRTWLAPSSAFTYVLVGRAERTAASRSGDKLPQLLPPGEWPPFSAVWAGRPVLETTLGAPRYGPSGTGSKPLIPTISGINIRRLPQSLGHFRAMWYGAGASFDRQTRTAR